MTGSRISSRSLLRETFATTKPLYAPLLIINSPSLIWFVLEPFGRDALNIHIIETTGAEHSGAGTFPVNPIYRLAEVPSWIYWWVAVPLLSGATIFYTYRSLTGNQVSVGEAFKHAYRRLPQLTLAWIPIALMFYIYVSPGVVPQLMFASISKVSPLVFVGLIALIISGLYLGICLQFSLYATTIDNAPAQDSISSSWKLTNEHWGLLFKANLLIGIVTAVPLQLITLLIYILMNYLPFGSSFRVICQLVVIVLQISMGVLTSVYFVLLYRRLRDSAATIQ